MKQQSIDLGESICKWLTDETRPDYRKLNLATVIAGLGMAAGFFITRSPNPSKTLKVFISIVTWAVETAHSHEKPSSSPIDSRSQTAGN